MNSLVAGAGTTFLLVQSDADGNRVPLTSVRFTVSSDVGCHPETWVVEFDASGAMFTYPAW